MKAQKCPVCYGTGVNHYSDNDTCNICDGYGSVPYTEEDVLNDMENECIGNKKMMEDN